MFRVGTGTYQKPKMIPGDVTIVGQTLRLSCTVGSVSEFSWPQLIAMAFAAKSVAENGKDVIPEDGERRDFKQCFLDQVEVLQYPCGHCFIPVYTLDGQMRDAIPLCCPHCDVNNTYIWNSNPSGVLNIDMCITIPQPVEWIQFDVTLPPTDDT